jgi:hypothetical protein
MTNTTDNVPDQIQAGYDSMVASLCAKGLVRHEDELTIALEQEWLSVEHGSHHKVVRAAVFVLDRELRVAVRIDRDLDLYRLVLMAEDSPGNTDRGGRAEVHQYTEDRFWKHVAVRGECNPSFCLLARAFNMQVPSNSYHSAAVEPIYAITMASVIFNWSSSFAASGA